MTAVAACWTCGTECLENARFCHACGSPVAEPAAHAEFKQVSVLFADVVHSMEIAKAVGAERWRGSSRHWRSVSRSFQRTIVSRSPSAAV